LGHDVVCVDNNPKKIESLHRGIIPIFEPGLAETTEEVVLTDQLQFTTDNKFATLRKDAKFIAVGIPYAAEGASSNLCYVFAAAQKVAEAINKFKAIIIKSTAPVGISQSVAEAIRKASPNAEFAVASNLEF
jgi:UDPglucose 6-dehydrogenase